MTLVPMVVLVGFELALHLIGYGHDTNFFRKIQIQGQDFYVPNGDFSSRFFPSAIARKSLLIRFAAEKSNNTYRIFLLGESAANGDPDPSYGFGRYLQVLLRERYPGTDFEVVCVAITAINSHVILPIARECVRHEGDLWIVYMGNNEMVGPFGAETAYGQKTPPLGFIRTVLALKTTRIGQLVDAAIQGIRSNSSTPKTWGGMEMFQQGRVAYDDGARLRGYAYFQRNLEDILQTALRADVPVILSTVAVNLKDCAPFASLHATGLDESQASAWNKIYDQGVQLESNGSPEPALGLYKKAAEIDPQYADLQFRMGTCNLALTNYDQARQDFELARDYDALDFRADSRINSAIKDAAARHTGQDVHMLDAAKLLAQNSPDGIPGLNFFYEHVHLNLAGNYLLALGFADQVKERLPSSITVHDMGSWASAEFCDRRLAVTSWDRQRVWQPVFVRIKSPPFTGQLNHAAYLRLCEAKWDEAKAQMNFQTPEEACKLYEEALALSPDDFYLHGNYEQLLRAVGRLTDALAQAKRCCELRPQDATLHYYVGTLLVRLGEISAAKDYFLQAIKLRSSYAEAQSELGEILANQNKPAEAVAWFKRAIRANPNYVGSYLNLGFLQQKQGKMDEAMASYSQAASLEPNGPADYFHRANLAASMYQTDDAIECLRGVLRAKPDFWQAHYQLGVRLMEKGNNEEARSEFAAVIRYRPDFAPMLPAITDGGQTH